MLPPKLILFLELSVTYASLLKVVPFAWDSRKNCLRYVFPKWKIWLWALVSTSMFAHQAFLIWRVSDSFWANNERISTYAAYIMYSFAHLCPSILQAHLILKREELMEFTNQYLQYFQHVQGKKLEWSTYLFMGIFTSVNPVFWVGFCVNTKALTCHVRN
jgi:hypothetical protein